VFWSKKSTARKQPDTKRVRQATFPVIKTLENFDFKAIPSLNKPKVLKLMQGEYIRKKENIILVGSSDVGKTQVGIRFDGHQNCSNKAC